MARRSVKGLTPAAPAGRRWGPPPARPPHVDTPWGVRWTQHPDGLYRGPAGDRAVSYSALADEVARYHERWAITPGGVRYCGSKDQVGIVFPDQDGTFRAGHCALHGDRDGVWLATGLSLVDAVRAVERWAFGRGPIGPHPPRERVVTILDR